jgi:hypothetical protein
MDAAERRARWMEPLPAVELADRLRRMPLFDFVSVDELFRVAGVGRQVRHENGRLVSNRARRRGRAVPARRGGDDHHADGRRERIEAPAPIGFFEVLEGVPGRSTVRAEDRAICLALRSEQWLGLLSENTELAQGLFRLVLEREAAQAWRGVVPGVLRQHAVLPAKEALQPIEKLLLVEEMAVFARASADDVAALAARDARDAARPGRAALPRRRPAGALRRHRG